MRGAPNDRHFGRYGLVFVGLAQLVQGLFVPPLQHIGPRQRRHNKVVEGTVFPGPQKFFGGGAAVLDFQIGVAEQNARRKICRIGLKRIFQLDNAALVIALSYQFYGVFIMFVGGLRRFGGHGDSGRQHADRHYHGCGLC